MERCSETLATKLENFNGQEVNVFPLSNLLALDVVCGKILKTIIIYKLITFFISECAMGIKLNSQIQDSAYARGVKE